MNSVFQRILMAAENFAPEGSARRKLLQILGIVCLFQGASVVFLSSKFGALVGLVVAGFGALLLLLIPLRVREKFGADAKGKSAETLGLRLVNRFVFLVGGVNNMVFFGIVVVAGVILHDAFVSKNPGYGDIDQLSLAFGFFLIVLPVVYERFRTEASFVLIFLSLIVLLLALPLAFLSSEWEYGSSAGNWYVHYLLAAPLVAMLNFAGISASSVGGTLTVVFRDGSVNLIGISTACAGLYSTTIFLSAFIAFVLVFESVPPKITALVLCVGLITAYLGNMLRMFVIVVIGYYNGISSLLWAHKNVGWMVFLSWSGVFWYLLIRYANRQSQFRREVASVARDEGTCESGSNGLSQAEDRLRGK